VVKASQLVIEGKGGTVPLAGNNTDEGRAKNRRVEITLLH
jgi:flagellar motor protein MotB